MANYHLLPRLPPSENFDRSHLLAVGRPIVSGSGHLSCWFSCGRLENSRERPNRLAGKMGSLICWIRDIITRPQDHRFRNSAHPGRATPRRAPGQSSEDLLGGDQLPGEPQGPRPASPPTRNHLDQTIPTTGCTSPRRADVGPLSGPLSGATGQKDNARWLRMGVGS